MESSIAEFLRRQSACELLPTACYYPRGVDIVRARAARIPARSLCLLLAPLSIVAHALVSRPCPCVSLLLSSPLSLSPVPALILLLSWPHPSLFLFPLSFSGSPPYPFTPFRSSFVSQPIPESFPGTCSFAQPTICWSTLLSTVLAQDHF